MLAAFRKVSFLSQARNRMYFPQRQLEFLRNTLKYRFSMLCMYLF